MNSTTSNLNHFVFRANLCTLPPLEVRSTNPHGSWGTFLGPISVNRMVIHPMYYTKAADYTYRGMWRSSASWGDMVFWGWRESIQNIWPTGIPLVSSAREHLPERDTTGKLQYEARSALGWYTRRFPCGGNNPSAHGMRVKLQLP